MPVDSNLPAEPNPAAEAGPDTAAAAPSADDAAARLEAAQAEISSLKDAALRAMAEAENVRRRAEREKADARAYAIERFARDLLPVADNLDRALSAAPEGLKGDPAFDGFAEGVAMTARELLAAFGRNGLERVGARGERFDPARHQAVAQIPSDTVASGEIADLFQAGWVLSGRTVRAAMVAVSAGPGPKVGDRDSDTGTDGPEAASAAPPAADTAG